MIREPKPPDRYKQTRPILISMARSLIVTLALMEVHLNLSERETQHCGKMINELLAPIITLEEEIANEVDPLRMLQELQMNFQTILKSSDYWLNPRTNQQLRDKTTNWIPQLECFEAQLANARALFFIKAHLFEWLEKRVEARRDDLRQAQQKGSHLDGSIEFWEGGVEECEAILRYLKHWGPYYRDDMRGEDSEDDTEESA